MAGDWIKLEHATIQKPEVYRIAEMLGLDRDAVVGKLVKLWVWADQQTVDGNAVSVTKFAINDIVCTTGFAEAMISVGWLAETEDGLTFPRFDRHNGNSAKKRGLTQMRVAKLRRENCNAASVTETLPEKRRVRERNEAPASISLSLSEAEPGRAENARLGGGVSAAEPSRGGDRKPDSNASSPRKALPCPAGASDGGGTTRRSSGHANGSPRGNSVDSRESGRDEQSVFRNLRAEHLRDLQGLRSWFEWQATAPEGLAPVLGADEWTLCVAAAEAALERGKAPHRLFAAIVGRRDLDKLTDKHYARATERISHGSQGG